METMTAIPALELTRHFNASPERVFDAWLSPAWAEWMPPLDATATLTLLEPKVGGRFAMSMTMGSGRQVAITGIYLEIDRPHRLVLHWHGDFCESTTTLTLTFTPEHGGTRMTLHQVGFDSTDLRQGFETGWGGEGGSFTKLDRLLAAV